MEITVNRKLIAETARISIETNQTMQSKYRTKGLNELAASFRRIEENPNWTPVQALQEHLDAMKKVCVLGTDIDLVKEGAGIFKNCWIMRQYLTKVEYASFRTMKE